MVYTFIDHKMTSKNVQNSRAAGEWFHCQVLDILRSHFMVYKSIRTIENGRRFVFYNNMEKVRAELAIFFFFFFWFRKRARYIWRHFYCLYSY